MISVYVVCSGFELGVRHDTPDCRVDLTAKNASQWRADGNNGGLVENKHRERASNQDTRSVSSQPNKRVSHQGVVLLRDKLWDFCLMHEFHQEFRRQHVGNGGVVVHRGLVDITYHTTCADA